MAMPQEPQTVELRKPRTGADASTGDAAAGGRIILIRHGQPNIALSPRTSHQGFRAYIDAYEAAGLDPQSAPPKDLRALVKDLTELFTSAKPRAHDSAKSLAPHAKLIVDPLFVEAPLAAPKIPLLKLRVQSWAVVARLLWHAGYHPDIEPYAASRARAQKAANILINRCTAEGTTALIAHGYFNFLIGRELKRQGHKKTGTHRARYWNAVIYEAQKD